MSIERLSAALADRYRIERELGQGGMATVYLAEDLKHKRKVAVKVLKPELAAVLGAERFVQEITTTAALQHPHILPLFDSGEANGFLYYVMPFIDGETLRTKLDRETQLGIDESVKIATAVADALDYAHRNGVIHRDIKPENILLHEGRPMVADFGIALALSAAAGGRMTETGLSLGTPHYMSPEQATAEREITARSDIYSLGSVLYEMLTGNPPHTGASAQQIIMKIITESAQPVTVLRKSVPPNVAAAVAKSIEKLPADRFENAKAFADALVDSSFVTNASGATSMTFARGGASRINRVLVALSVILVVALVWQTVRQPAGTGPRAYDVALPDSAPLNATKFGDNFVVSPLGDFVLYVRGGRREIWYRSLLVETVRRVDATEQASRPTISGDGRQFAFIREGNPESTVEIMSIAGGTPTVIARTRDPNSVRWMPDSRILLTEGDGNRARLLDAGGGSATTMKIQFCINPTPLPEPSTILCGGGGNKEATWSNLRDSSAGGTFKMKGSNSAFVFGSDFRIVAGKYLVYVSNGGDLLAAPVDLAAKRVGRSVRMVTGLERTSYSGNGTYGISANGTLVYSNGINRAVGNLVRTNGKATDTLHVGREAFLQFAMSPDGRRLAAVVERFDGHELRIYDLRSGEYVVWKRGAELRQPLWSAKGDRLVSFSRDSMFIGAPDATTAPELVLSRAGFIEGFSWLPDGRLVATDWNSQSIVSVDLAHRSLKYDTLAKFAVIGRASPDGRWLAYNGPEFSAAWIEPLPRTGQRLSAGSGDYPQWLSASELVTSTDSGRFERIRVAGSADAPRIVREPWFNVPRLVGIAAGGFSLTSDGKVIFKQGSDGEPARYLRVVPHWIDQMKKAVDQANR